MSFVADYSNSAVLELFGTRFGYFCVVLVKMTRKSFLFTCCDVFQVIGWFPHENSQKCEFCCRLVKRGYSGAVRDQFWLFLCCFRQNDWGIAPFHLLRCVRCIWMVSARKLSKMWVLLQTGQTGLFWSCSGPISIILVLFQKKRHGDFHVFLVIRWFPHENSQKCMFFCRLVKRGCYGVVGDPFRLFLCCFRQNDPGITPFHLFAIVSCNWMVPARKLLKVWVLQQTSQTGLFWSCSGPVSVISVLFLSKRPGDRSFSLVVMCFK